MPVSADELYAWHMQPGAFEKLVPPWQKLKVVDRPERLEEGAVVVLRVYLGPLGVTWRARHRDFIEARQFVDEQVGGPFGHWVHTHRFIPTDDGTSLLTDHIDYAPPLGVFGRVAHRSLARMLDRMFTYRHQRTRDDLLAR
jgi:uncharacterized protein